MKIAFLSNKDPSLLEIDTDGGAVTPRYYALELGKRGHDVDIYTPEILAEDTHNTYLRDKYNAQRAGKQQLGKNIRIIRLPIKTINRNNFITEETKDLPGIIESTLFADAFKEGQLSNYDVVNFFHPLTAHGVINRNMLDLRRAVLFPMLLSNHYLKYQSLSKAYCEMEQLLLTKVGNICSTAEDEKRLLIRRGILGKK